VSGETSQSADLRDPGAAGTLHSAAEGVETQEQQRLLYLLRCDQMQGYYFSRPVPAQALAALVRLNAASGHTLRDQRAQSVMTIA
jgi:predicted signal transduction protein with EAL and GGDEF domain